MASRTNDSGAGLIDVEPFDPMSPEVFVDGVDFHLLARLRAHGSLCPTPQGEWYVATHAEIDEVLREVDTYRADLSQMSGLTSLDEVPDDQLFLSEITEPRHGRIRRLFNAGFAPHRVRGLVQSVRSIVGDLADDLVEDGSGDLHDDYAAEIPNRVMAHAMGLDQAAAALFKEWSFDGSIMSRPASPQNAGGGPAIQTFFRSEVQRRRQLDELPDDVVSLLMTAEIDGQRLGDQEIATQLHFMIQAGVHTTRGMIAHLVHRLLIDPTLFDRLRRDRSLLPAYVEESLRFDSPVQRTTRRVTVDTELAGQALQANDVVLVGIGSSNRDETVFSDPESFNLERTDGKAHQAFGAGSHICPGATLARIEGLACVEALLDRVVSMQPIEGVKYPPLPGNLVHTPIPARFEV